MDSRAAIARAITVAGSQPKLAARAGISQQHISKILNAQRSMSADVAIAIERATEGAVKRWELRPDYWDAPSGSRAASPEARL